jgi:two-component system, sensor histidine kinase PdtaS
MAAQANLLERISRWEPNALPDGLRWGVAALAFAVALAVRYELDGALPPGFPYLTFFPAILISAYFLGPAPGIAVAVASGLAAWYFFIPPVMSFEFNGATVVALAFYAFVAATEIGLTTLAQRARRALHAERRAKELLAEQRQLMFHELQHRVSNNLATVSGLLKLQRRIVSDEAAGVALEDSVRRIDLVSRIMRNLHDPSGQTVDMARFLADTGRDILESTGAASRVALKVAADPLLVGPDVSVPLGLIATELLANTLEHGFPGESVGQIGLSLGEGGQAGRAILRIQDNGQGLPDAFDIDKTRSLGLSIARQFAKQLGGTLVMERRPEGGTEARLEFSY